MRVNDLAMGIGADTATRHKHTGVETKTIIGRFLKGSEPPIDWIATLDCVPIRQTPPFFAAMEILVDPIVCEGIEICDRTREPFWRDRKLAGKFVERVAAAYPLGGTVPGTAPANEKPSTYWRSKIR